MRERVCQHENNPVSCCGVQINRVRGRQIHGLCLHAMVPCPGAPPRYLRVRLHLLMVVMTPDLSWPAYAAQPSAKAGDSGVTKQVSMKNMSYSFAVGHRV